MSWETHTRFGENYQVGEPLNSDTYIVTREAKDPHTLSPGDFVKINDEGKVEKITDKKDTIFGIVTYGIVGELVPIIYRGVTVGIPSTTIFNTIKTGEYLSHVSSSVGGTGGQNKTMVCNNSILIMGKLKVKQNGKLVDACLIRLT